MSNLSTKDIEQLAMSVLSDGGFTLCLAADAGGQNWRLAMLPVSNPFEQPCWSVQVWHEWEEAGVRKANWVEDDAYYHLADAMDSFLACVGEMATETEKVSAL